MTTIYDLPNGHADAIRSKTPTPKKRIAVVGINDHGEAMLDEITVHRHQSEIRTDAGYIQQTVN